MQLQTTGTRKRRVEWVRWASTKISSTFMIVISSKLTSNLFELAGEFPDCHGLQRLEHTYNFRLEECLG